MPLTGIALLAALALAGCGDGGPEAEQDGAAGSEDQTAQVGSETGDGEDDGQDAGADEEGEGGEDSASAPGSSAQPFATAEMTDQASNEIGSVSFTEVADGVLIEAAVHDLDAGFRGITIHERGVCEPLSTSESGVFGDFESSGGHLLGTAEEDMGIVEGEEAPEDEAPEGEDPETNLDDLSGEAPPAEPDAMTHPDHAGDLPNLLVNEDRTGWLSLVSDRLDPDDLLGGEGSSVIVHAQADNHANVPERYTGLGPDAESLASGDSGSRMACGVVEEQ